MMKWLKRARGAIGMGLTWALAWAVAGVMIGVASVVFPALPWDAFFEVFDAPLPALAVPGFFGGMLFSLVLGVAARHRRLEELSVGHTAAWGALGGMLLSLLPAAMVSIGLASTAGSRLTLGQSTGAIFIPLTVLSALSAAGSLLIARKSASPEFTPSDPAAVSVGEGANLVFRGGLVPRRESRAARAARKTL